MCRGRKSADCIIIKSTREFWGTGEVHPTSTGDVTLRERGPGEVPLTVNYTLHSTREVKERGLFQITNLAISHPMITKIM